ncbi:MAG: radical SAM protein, partial [Myxococcota bacterium]
ARCTLACPYCHAEGDLAVDDAAGGLPRDVLVPLLAAGLANGVRKLKFLGGEPLMRRDLPDVIRDVRALAPDLDVSLITAGAVDVARLDACLAAGLSRANLSIHGWTPAAFAERTRRPLAYGLRARVLERLLAEGRFLKLNYVWRGPHDDTDLAGLLAWAAGKPVVVGLLDELSLGLGAAPLRDALVRLRGPWADARPEPDPASLPTERLSWADGLVVEVKDHRLGDVAPWTACAACPKRAACGEGIHALRLTHTGTLRPCMDRTDLGVDLRAALASGGTAAAAEAWRGFVTEASR